MNLVKFVAVNSILYLENFYPFCPYSLPSLDKILCYRFARDAVERFCKNRRSEGCSLLIGVNIIAFTHVQ
jgi:hypothetical protein